MEWSFGDFFWATVVFFFWFAFIWMFISIFADIFRRDDLSGWGKAGWILLIVALPFLGILIYTIARPRITESDARIMAQLHEPKRATGSYSAAEEIEKLVKLRDAGTITPAEFERLKRSAMV